MLLKHGGRETVRRLRLDYPNHDSDGYARLALVGALDHTIEIVMTMQRFRLLFSVEELAWAEEVVPAELDLPV